MPGVAGLRVAESVAVIRGPYAWPADVAIVGWAAASGATAAAALVAAIGEALVPLGSAPGVASADRAIVVGTQSAAINETVHFASEIRSLGATIVNPALFPQTVMNAPAGIAAIRHRCEGPNVTLCNGATSALDAVVAGADLISSRRSVLACAGGVETALTRLDLPVAAPSRAVVVVLMSGARAHAAALPVYGRCVAHLRTRATGAPTPADAAAVHDAWPGLMPSLALDVAACARTPEQALGRLAQCLSQIVAGSEPLAMVLSAEAAGGRRTTLVLATADRPDCVDA